MADLTGLREGWCLYPSEDGRWTVGAMSGFYDTVSALATAATVEDAIVQAGERVAREEVEQAERDAGYRRRRSLGELSMLEQIGEDLARGQAEAVVKMIQEPTAIRRWLDWLPKPPVSLS